MGTGHAVKLQFVRDSSGETFDFRNYTDAKSESRFPHIFGRAVLGWALDSRAYKFRVSIGPCGPGVPVSS